MRPIDNEINLASVNNLPTTVTYIRPFHTQLSQIGKCVRSPQPLSTLWWAGGVIAGVLVTSAGFVR